MTKIKMRKRSRKVWFQYLPWTLLKHYNMTVDYSKNGDIGVIGSFRIIQHDDTKEMK